MLPGAMLSEAVNPEVCVCVCLLIFARVCIGVCLFLCVCAQDGEKDKKERKER